MYKLKSKYLLIVALMVLSIMTVVVGCGKRHTVTITTESAIDGYYIGSPIGEIKEGSSYDIIVTANFGLSLDNLVVKVNGNQVQGKVYANINGEDIETSDQAADEYMRFWKYTISKVTSNLEIFVDFSNCGLIERTIKLEGLDTTNAFYAKRIVYDNNEDITELDSSIISTPKKIINNKINLKYNESIYIFWDQNIRLYSDQGSIHDPLQRYTYKYYKYNDLFVYHIKDITKNLTITKAPETDSEYRQKVDKLANINFISNTDSLIQIDFYGNSLSNEALDSLNGYRDYYYSYVYIGDKQSYLDEQINDNINQYYLDVLGKKAYYRIYTNPNWLDASVSVQDVASFYLVDDIYADTSSLTPLEIKGDSTLEYLEIDKSDLQEFIQDDRAFVYLKTVVIEDTLKDYVGFKLNYLNDDSNTGLTMLINSVSKEASYYEFTNNREKIYYFHKSLFDNEKNNLSISIGTASNYVIHPYIISAKLEIKDNLSIIDSQEVTYNNTETYLDNVNIPVNKVKVQDDINNVLEITINTTYQEHDTSAHAISFDELLSSSPSTRVFITDSLTNPEWIEVRLSNLSRLNNLTISTTNPLYYYYEDSPKTIVLELFYGSKLVSGFSPVVNVFNSLVLKPINNHSRIINALYLFDTFMPNEAPLTVTFG